MAIIQTYKSLSNQQILAQTQAIGDDFKSLLEQTKKANNYETFKKVAKVSKISSRKYKTCRRMTAYEGTSLKNLWENMVFQIVKEQYINTLGIASV